MSEEFENLARAIVEWSLNRPLWERQALRILSLGEVISEDVVKSLADVAEQEAAGTPQDLVPFEVSDILGSDQASDEVRLIGISEPKAVNALTWVDGLVFAQQGITLIYGENGSGKSGYARILKKVTRARHEGDILSNVFEAPAEQSARLTVSCGSSEHKLAWPADNPDFLSRVSFYDSECARRYISTDNEVAYRPSSIACMNDLVRVANRVRSELEGRRARRRSNATTLPPNAIRYSCG